MAITERPPILKKNKYLLLLIPLLIFLAGWLCLHLGWILAGTVLLRILQVLIAIAAIIFIFFEWAVLEDGSAFWLGLLSFLATLLISCGMIWICDSVLQGYGIASSFVSGFIEVISELLG